MTSSWTAIILQIASAVRVQVVILIVFKCKEKLRKNIEAYFCTRQIIERENVAGPVKIGDRCQANTDVCQESFNYALCINERCQCITGYHFVNETKTCMYSLGTHLHFFSTKKEKDNRLRLPFSRYRKKTLKNSN